MAANLLRTLLVRLGVSVTPTTKAEVAEFNAKIAQVKRTMSDAVTWTHRLAVGLATVATAGAAAMLGLSVETGKHATEIENQARLLLLTRQEYQEWLFVAERAGANSRDLADAFLQINDAAQRAIGGEKSMVETFGKLGITAKQLKGLDPGGIFELMAQQASGATDKAKALSAASSLLGEEAARQFGPLMMKGVAAIKAMRNEAGALGLVLTDKQLAAMAAVNVEWGQMRNVLKGLRMAIAAALAPVLLKVLRSLNTWIKANRELIASRLENWIRRLGLALESAHRLVAAVGGWDVIFLNVATGVGLLTLLANLDKLKALLTGAHIAFTALKVVGLAVASALGIGLAPLTAILAGLLFFIGLLALGLEDLWVWWQGGNSLLGANLDLIEQFIPAFGAVRDLVWALVEAFGVAWTNAGRFAEALLQGMAPALQLIDLMLQPLIDKLMELWGWWVRLNEKVGGGIEGLTSFVRWAADTGDRAGAGAAPMLQAAVAGSVQAGVDGAVAGASYVANHANTETINQVNQFVGASAREIAEGVKQYTESTRRKARAAAAGGPR